MVPRTETAPLSAVSWKVLAVAVPSTTTSPVRTRSVCSRVRPARARAAVRALVAGRLRVSRLKLPEDPPAPAVPTRVPSSWKRPSGAEMRERAGIATSGGGGHADFRGGADGISPEVAAKEIVPASVKRTAS